MHDSLRQELAAAVKLLVVKVGTRVLTRDDGTLNEERIAQLAEELNDICETGRNVILVSSGAVGAGMSQLGLPARPIDLAKLQAVAAVGQTRLIQTYDRTFRKHGRHAAQVLLIADDLRHRTRYLNVRNTLFTLLDYRAIPVINENDTVSVEELQTTFGDNDRLAAMVTNMVRAQLLVLVSDVEGLYDGDPSEPGHKVVSTVPQLDESIYNLVRDKKTGLSKGGMASKLEAARVVTTGGEHVIITSGRQPGNLRRIIAGETVGTLFVAQGKQVAPRKRWIGLTLKPRGQLRLDAGASRAIRSDGRSLLAAGIVQVTGEFEKGDTVMLCDHDGTEIARGLTNYSSDDVERIRGCKSNQIAKVLGHRPYEEVVHRDNLIVLR